MKEEFTVERSARKDGYTSFAPELYYRLNVFSVEGFDQQQILKVRAIIKQAQKQLDTIIDERLDQLTPEEHKEE